MISGWLVKLIVSLAVAALLIFEAGSPLMTRVQLDGVAAETARQAHREYSKTGSKAAATKKAEETAAESGAVLAATPIFTADAAAVTVSRKAPSVIFGKWDKTKSYYDVKVDGLSEGGL
ncbi:MAG TPA: hypothetical protein VMY88_01955 [Acidimicrobiales bacterium]|nr:hypothetical protein [Acidimicrobiales bacterium]